MGVSSAARRRASFNARAFDVNGVVAAAVGENGGGFGGDFLTKISLRSPDSARTRVALPAGTGLVRDVRLTNGGSSSLIDGSANGRALALAATLGKKLLVVDLDRDHVAARIDLPHAAWSCAWGGWATESHDSNAFVSLPGGEFRVAPRVALNSNSNGRVSDPCLDPNLCVVGGANGETLMYDLRATRARAGAGGASDTMAGLGRQTGPHGDSARATRRRWVAVRDVRGRSRVHAAIDERNRKRNRKRF